MSSWLPERELTFSRMPSGLNLVNFKLGNKYIILDRIGCGESSTIYYGIEEATGLQRAFKFYNLKQIQSSRNFKEKEICKRLSNLEYDMMKKCKSINLLKCEDIYEDIDYKVMVYEYCNMGSLHAEIERRGKTPTDQVRAIIILKQVLSALKSLHSDCHVLHKNLKSKNILIKNGLYKLIDFGMPRVMGEEKEDDGNFMVPEILKKHFYDSKAEVWSVGVLFHEILLGRLPPCVFNQRTLFAKINSRADTSAFELETECGDYSEEVIDFLRRCLEIEPEKRMTWHELQNHVMLDLVSERGAKRVHALGGKRVQKRVERLSSILMIEQSIFELEEEAVCQQQIYGLRFNLEKDRREIERELQKSYLKHSLYFSLMQLQRSGMHIYRENIDKTEEAEYLQIKQYYEGCLKVDFIIRDIVQPLIDNSYFDIAERESIELVYLLSSRCFAEISKVNFQTESRRPSAYHNLLVDCVKRATSTLYAQVQGIWREYSEKLTKKESEFVNLVADKFKSWFSGNEYNDKDRYFVGIESVDYTTEEQINFTMKFYQQKVNGRLAGHIEEQEQEREEIYGLIRLMSYMQVYPRVWAVQEYISDRYASVREYVEGNLLKSARS